MAGQWEENLNAFMTNIAILAPISARFRMVCPVPVDRIVAPRVIVNYLRETPIGDDNADPYTLEVMRTFCGDALMRCAAIHPAAIGARIAHHSHEDVGLDIGGLYADLTSIRADEPFSTMLDQTRLLMLSTQPLTEHSLEPPRHIIPMKTGEFLGRWAIAITVDRVLRGNGECDNQTIRRLRDLENIPHPRA